jgi:dTDP-4-amino-4,6-dideoxygalactose transaminase
MALEPALRALNPTGAVMGICNLRHTRDEIKKRGKVVQRYHFHLECVRDISHRVLMLPLYAGLAFADVDRICKIILDCGKEQ